MAIEIVSQSDLSEEIYAAPVTLPRKDIDVIYFPHPQAAIPDEFGDAQLKRTGILHDNKDGRAVLTAGRPLRVGEKGLSEEEKLRRGEILDELARLSTVEYKSSPNERSIPNY